MGAVYLFHDLYGYLLEMSPDIADLVEAFADGANTDTVIDNYKGDGDALQFIDVLVAHSILVEPADDELEAVWPFVPIKGKWNVWQRNHDRLALWTAWGNRAVTKLELDPAEVERAIAASADFPRACSSASAWPRH